jgi:hypothetical protein
MRVRGRRLTISRISTTPSIPGNTIPIKTRSGFVASMIWRPARASCVADDRVSHRRGEQLPDAQPDHVVLVNEGYREGRHRH